MPRLIELLILFGFIVFIVIPVLIDYSKILYKKLKKEKREVEDFIKGELNEHN